MKLKFCGIRRLEDVAFCNALQPDYMGMILSEGFRRTVPLDLAAKLAAAADSRILKVGVFVDASPERIAEVLHGVQLDVIQLHGSESAETVQAVRCKTGLPVWKAVRVQSAAEIAAAQQLGADQLILEGYVPGQVGGTGVTANWSLLASNRPQQPFFLAGGLKPENVAKAMALVQPDGVDFSSGIETDGVKDYDKMERIVKLVRGENHG